MMKFFVIFAMFFATSSTVFPQTLINGPTQSLILVKDDKLLVFAYREVKLHNITANDWSRRKEFGVSTEARFCDSNFYLHSVHSNTSAVGEWRVGLLVALDDKIFPAELDPIDIITVNEKIDTLFMQGIAQSHQIKDGVPLEVTDNPNPDLKFYLVISAETLSMLNSCATRFEVNT